MIFVTDIFLINLNYFLYLTLSFTFKWIFLPFGPLFVQYWLIFENISSEYQNVEFSFEDEKLGSLSIFDAKTFRFRLCFISTYPKKAVLYTLLSCIFSLVHGFKTFYLESNHLKTI